MSFLLLCYTEQQEERFIHVCDLITPQRIIRIAVHDREFQIVLGCGFSIDIGHVVKTILLGLGMNDVFSNVGNGL